MGRGRRWGKQKGRRGMITKGEWLGREDERSITSDEWGGIEDRWFEWAGKGDRLLEWGRNGDR